MSDKYISATKLKAHYSWLGKDATLSPKDVDDIVDAQPAADVEPVVRAGFVRFTDGSWHCSNCTDELPVDDDDFQPSHAAYREKYTAYCSRCGAKLDAGSSAILDAAHMERSGSGE
jgi:hypothetical protein